MNIQWGTLYLMNCIDITLLCVFKKSLSNIYVAFFLERTSVFNYGVVHVLLEATALSDI